MAGWIGAAIGTLGSIGSTIVGSLAARKYDKEAEREVDNQEKAGFNRYYNSQHLSNLDKIGRTIEENTLAQEQRINNPVGQKTAEQMASERMDAARQDMEWDRATADAYAQQEQTNKDNLYEMQKDVATKRQKIKAGQSAQVINAASQGANIFLNSVGKFANETSGSKNGNDVAEVKTGDKGTGTTTRSATTNGAASFDGDELVRTGKKNLFDGWGFDEQNYYA